MLPAYQSGHYGLRMYRQTLNPKYKELIWIDMARVASTLNYLGQMDSEKKIIERRDYLLKRYFDKITPESSKRTKLRQNMFKMYPNYIFAATLLGSMIRADEYGLKSIYDSNLRNMIKILNFSEYVKSKMVVEAYAAQIANQVFYLAQLGEDNNIDVFINTFRETYPDDKDSSLSKQQFENKIYGMTHIIFAASRHYQLSINQEDYLWIYKYMEKNIDTILEKAKPDVVAEVGITFLLSNQPNHKVVKKTQQFINDKIDKMNSMILSEKGSNDIEIGEHRNVLAIMLLDWKGVHVGPNIQNNHSLFSNIPFGLVIK